MHVSPALAAVCKRHGLDVAGLSPAQLQEHLPRIIRAVEAERRSTLQAVVEVQKSALAVSGFHRLIPNEGITRAERIDETSTSDATDNSIFDSMIPWE